MVWTTAELKMSAESRGDCCITGWMSSLSLN